MVSLMSRFLFFWVSEKRSEVVISEFNAVIACVAVLIISGGKLK